MNLKNPIPSISSQLHLDSLLFFVHALGIIGLFYSRALTTVSLILIVIVGFSSWQWSKVRAIFSDRIFLPFTIIFVLAILSGWNTADHHAYMTTLRIKLPFLLLPISFFFLHKVNTSFAINLHHWLLCATVAVGFPVLAFALKNYEAMLDIISKGQAIPTPIEHVKYSMINAYGVITGICLFLFRRHRYNNLERILLIASIIFLMILIHVLSVRTGIIIVYISLFLLGLLTFVKYRSVKGLLVSIVVAALLPLIAYHAIPTVQQKVGYMLYDWKKYQAGEGDQYSDSERMTLNHAALDIWRESPVFGVGFGDVQHEMNQWFEMNMDTYGPKKLPHNQFLLYLAGTGALGLIVFLYGYYYPLRKCYSLSVEGILLMMLYANFTLSFFVENSIERSVSVAFFLLMALPLMKNIQLNKSEGKSTT